MAGIKGCALNYTINNENFIIFSFMNEIYEYYETIFNLKKMKFTSINIENNNNQIIK